MKRTKTNPRPTLYLLLFDNSRSMMSVATPARQAFSKIIDSIIENATSGSDFIMVDTFGTLKRPMFSYRVDQLRDPGVRDTMRRIVESYSPIEACTKLNDSIIEALESGLASQVTDNGIFEAGLLYVITDGLENSSRATTSETASRIKQKMKMDRWTIAMQVPVGAKRTIQKEYGLPANNVSTWAQTEYGTYRASVQTVSAIRNYTQSRASGRMSSQDFYAQTNASKVTPDALKRQCLDVTRKIKKFTVERETEVRPFIEKKLARPYVIGSAYYQLMKPEKVQADKEVLIVEKGRNTVYGGPNARALIGIPTGVPVKVEPGNHSNFDIYVQSRSVNRKLPRGTSVLVDVKQTKSLVPTWDHTQVTQ